MAISRSQMKRQLYEGGGISTLQQARDILEAEALPGESLAYINPQEAAMLKYMGGAGIPINSSGIPSYFVKSIGKAVKGAVKGVTGAVKGAVGAVKDIVSSDVGKLALLAAGVYYAPALFSGTVGFGPTSTYGSFARGLMSPNLIGPMTQAGSLGRTISSALTGGGVGSLFTKGNLVSAGLGFLGGAAAGGSLSGEQIAAGMKRNPTAVRAYLAQYYKNINPEATEEEAEQYAQQQTREYAAEGGIIGRQNYGLGSLVGRLVRENPQILQPMTRLVNQPQAIKPLTNIQQMFAQYYGNINPRKSVEEIEAYARENAAYGGPMGEPRQNQQGVKELDYRQEGGFVPVGIKEKADDVPAMLSKNEFVFTADAVRGAGNGDVEKGAQRLYNTMKTLENGGTV